MPATLSLTEGLGGSYLHKGTLSSEKLRKCWFIIICSIMFSCAATVQDDARAGSSLQGTRAGNVLAPAPAHDGTCMGEEISVTDSTVYEIRNVMCAAEGTEAPSGGAAHL